MKQNIDNIFKQQLNDLEELPKGIAFNKEQNWKQIDNQINGSSSSFSNLIKVAAVVAIVLLLGWGWQLKQHNAALNAQVIQLNQQLVIQAEKQNQMEKELAQLPQQTTSEKTKIQIRYKTIKAMPRIIVKHELNVNVQPFVAYRIPVELEKIDDRSNQFIKNMPEVPTYYESEQLASTESPKRKGWFKRSIDRINTEN
jgi:cell division protein FtsB